MAFEVSSVPLSLTIMRGGDFRACLDGRPSTIAEIPSGLVVPDVL